MSLIQPKRIDPIYANLVGGINSAGNVQIAVIPFASSLLSANGVSIVNDYTVSVSESGLYELLTPISIAVDTFSGNWVSYVEIGKNFNFTTYAQSTMSISACTGFYSFLVELNKNDTFSLRSQVTGTFTGHTTRCNMFDSGTNKNGGLTFPTITFKRI